MHDAMSAFNLEQKRSGAPQLRAGIGIHSGELVAGNVGGRRRMEYTVIGDDVTVGHGAKFESCTIGDRTVVGMNAVILPEAVIGKNCVLAANTVVLERALIPDLSVVAGVPGKVKKTLVGSAAKWVERSAQHYVALSREYLAQGIGRVREE